jgi:DnaJ-domain-containing protein 1
MEEQRSHNTLYVLLDLPCTILALICLWCNNYTDRGLSTNVDHFAVLGIPRTASADEIKRAYLKVRPETPVYRILACSVTHNSLTPSQMAKKHHPDLNKHDPNAHQQFLQIQKAYEVLG